MKRLRTGAGRTQGSAGPSAMVQAAGTAAAVAAAVGKEATAIREVTEDEKILLNA